MPAGADILLRACGTEDRDRNRPALRNIIAVDAGGDIVTQPDGSGALHEAAFGALLHQREPATALPQEIRSPRSVGQNRRGVGHEDETWLMKACRRSPRSDADHVAERARDLGAR